MPLPKQNIPDKEKDLEWRKMCVMSIVKMVGNTYLVRQRDKFCYDLHNGIFDQGDYDYLRKVDSYEYPAKIRFIPILRPRIDLLRSRETKRPFNFRVYTVDMDSIKSKEDARYQEFLGSINSKLFEHQQMIKQMQTQIQKKQQEIQQAQQGGSQGGQQGGNQQQGPSPEEQQQLDQMMQQLEAMLQPLSSNQAITQKEVEEIDIKFRYKYRDILENISQKGLKYLIAKYNIRDIFNNGFEDKLVTDKEIYYVNYHPGDSDPILRRVNPLNFFYSNDDEADWLGDCQWAMEERWMTVNQVVDEFKAELSAEDVDTLMRRNWYDYNNTMYSNGYQYSNSADYNTEAQSSNTLYSGTNDYTNKMRVCYVTWQSPRELKFKKSPNKHVPGDSFTHFVDDNETRKLREGEDIEISYVNDTWEGVLIDNGVFCRLRKLPAQLRSVDEYGKVQLPYIGKAFNGLNRKPYSIVWAAKDIQILYNLVNYHKELMLALSGVKGFIMDKSQVPDGMSMQEWVYQKKMGVGWIQTVREGMGRQSTFNQFQTFDDTISPSIKVLIDIMTHLEQLAGDVTGVSRQSLGSITHQDAVGTSEQSIQQSNLVTEIIYYEHDQIKRLALSRLVNLCKIAWKSGKRGSYVLGDFSQEILNIAPNTINKADYEVFMSDGGKEERAINELKQLAGMGHKEGMIPLQNLAKIYNMESIKEIEVTLEKFGEIAEQKAQANQGAENDHEMQKIQAEQEFQKLMEGQKSQISQMANQVSMAKIAWEKEKFAQEQELAKIKMAQDKYLKEMEIAANVRTEEQYLAEQAKEAAISAKLNQLEINAGMVDTHHKNLLTHKKIQYDKTNNSLKTPKK
jgi:hypothetical protein